MSEIISTYWIVSILSTKKGSLHNRGVTRSFKWQIKSWNIWAKIEQDIVGFSNFPVKLWNLSKIDVCGLNCTSCALQKVEHVTNVSMVIECWSSNDFRLALHQIHFCFCLITKQHFVPKVTFYSKWRSNNEWRIITTSTGIEKMRSEIDCSK